MPHFKSDIGLPLLFINKKKGLSLKYFESFADTPRKYYHFASFISNIKKSCHSHKIAFRLDTIKKPIQGPYLKLCGLYATFAIIKSHHNRQSSLKKLFEQFSTNFKINDSKILSFMYKQWPGESCHNNPIYNNTKMSLELLRKQPPFCPKKTLSAKKCFDKCKCTSSLCCEEKAKAI